MIENLGRKLAAIAAVLLLGLAAVLVPAVRGKPVVNLGLDLQGGSRLVYRFDFERARAEGQISSAETADEVLEQTIQIISQRVDALGLREIPISKQGSDGVVIELPGLAKEDVENIKSVIENLGQLEFRIIVDPGLDGVDLDKERRKVDEWLAKNPKAKIGPFNSLDEKDGGPRRGIRWAPLWEDPGDPTRRAPDVAIGAHTFSDFVPLRLEEVWPEGPHEEWIFRGEHLAYAGATRDEKGAPAVAFEFRADRKTDFRLFTKTYEQRAMAIVLNGEIRSNPTIREELPGQGRIDGGSRGFRFEEMKELITVLRTGSLRLQPTIDSESSIGPSLGEDAVRLGALSAALGSLLVFVFMGAYYRLCGAIANVGILLNVGLILAALAFFRGTLTLPGIGGIALTVGMAVDANILIYERIREEREKGRTLAQSVANGFDRAFSAIVDSNLTTLLAGLILFKVGTGPIKGFAVTLCVGILTTLFVALVFTRVLFHLLLSGNRVQELRMMRLLSRPNLRFSRYRHACIAASTLLILGGLLVFLKQGESLYGLDFTGGAVLRVRTKEPTSIGEIRDRVLAQFGGAQVSAVRGEGTDAASLARGVSKEFAIKVKLTFAERAAPSGGWRDRKFVEDIRLALGDLLKPRPILDLSLEPQAGAGDAQAASAAIHLEKPVSAGEIVRVLEAAGLREASAEPGPGGPAGAAWRIRGTVAKEMTTPGVYAALVDAFASEKTDAGEAFALSEPIPEAEVIGPRVVRELRDKAILAMFLSWLGMLLYLRIRFHEYRYGIAAVVALVHDVLVTLGAISVANTLGLVDVEIDLSMIAAFLTIVGFSVNDTIVIYDRIRENLPRHTDHLGRLKTDMTVVVDEAVNQTLSRTIMTSGTVLLTMVAMFLVNRGAHTVLEGWAFAMSVGVVTGTYSTVYIASPLLVTLEKLAKRRPSPAAVPVPPGPQPGAGPSPVES